MIIDLPSTSTSAINKALVDLRDSGGAVALGRVLTLVVVTDDARAENAITAANEASREHPCRVLVLARGNKRGAARLDAQIRIGGDAGASEVVVLRLYGPLVEHGETTVVSLLLPDAPIVAWWVGEAPDDLQKDPISRIAQRRITDAAASRSPHRSLLARAASYQEGDTDLAWTRLTNWRALLAAALDQPPYEPVTQITVAGSADSPSTDLLAAWLGWMLKAPVTRVRTARGRGVQSVRLERKSGAVQIVRPDESVATLSQPGQPDRRIALARRSLPDCITEELRRLDPDEVYGETLSRGMALVGEPVSAAAAQKAGKLNSPAVAAREQAEALKQAARTSRAVKRARPEEPTARTPEPAAEESAPATKKTAAKKTATKTTATKKTATKSAAKTSAPAKKSATKTATKSTATTGAGARGSRSRAGS
ncbi:glucose-6-phosphate dehydrogenase assembly protein OpcA [Kineococcus gynurae]|uniref:Glucose-6-phosphate dehydrogenase assembly protein OpcA n=1 Tax=Kineococcus gynurae TaxID=452979 RepID=A0ABV5LQN2_9ACTN